MNTAILSLLITIQGIVISVALLRLKSEKCNPYRWLSFLILLLSAVIVLSPENGILPYEGFTEICALSLYLVGPVLLAFIRSLTGFSLSKKMLFILFLPALIVLGIFALSHSSLYNTAIGYYLIELFYEQNWIGSALLEMICILVSFISLKKSAAQTQNFSAGNESLLAGQASLFLSVYALLFLIDIAITILGYYYIDIFDTYNSYMAILNALWFSFIAYLLITDKERVGKFQKASTSLVKYQRSGVTVSEADTILKRAKHFLDEKKYYLENECTLQLLADHLGVTLHELSQVINEGTEGNFSLFINRYRVKHAEQMLLNPSNNHFSVLQVALHSGFSSKATFNRVFRSITGNTPTEYRKMQS